MYRSSLPYFPADVFKPYHSLSPVARKAPKELPFDKKPRIGDCLHCYN